MVQVETNHSANTFMFSSANVAIIMAAGFLLLLPVYGGHPSLPQWPKRLFLSNYLPVIVTDLNLDGMTGGAKMKC